MQLEIKDCMTTAKCNADKVNFRTKDLFEERMLFPRFVDHFQMMKLWWIYWTRN